MKFIDTYSEFIDLKGSGLKQKARELADELIHSYLQHPDYEFVISLCEKCEHKLDHIIWMKIVFPELKDRLESDPRAIRALIKTIQNLYTSQSEWKDLDYITSEELTIRLLEMQPDDKWAKDQRIKQLRGWLAYSIHEWPAGILYGNDGASLSECSEIQQAIDELSELDASGNSKDLCLEVKSKLEEYVKWIS